MATTVIARRVNAERLVVLGWSRAILLQLAHPLVAAGVAEHSSFREGRLAAARRLHLTIRAMLALTFGDAAGRAAALAGIREIHRRVHGRLPVASGPFPAGTPYAAEDPDLVLWVHATLLDSVPMIYERIAGPLSPLDRDAYCAEAAALPIELGARPHEVPRTWRELLAYLDRMHASGTITVSAQARELGAAVLSPRLTPLVAPVAWINRLVTIGLLPAGIRAQYNFDWTASEDRSLRCVLRVLRAARRVTPATIALWPEAL